MGWDSLSDTGADRSYQINMDYCTVRGLGILLQCCHCYLDVNYFE